MANNYNNATTGGIDIATFWRILIDNRLVIGICASLTTVLAIVVAFVITPVYRAEVLMAPVTQSDQGVGLGALAGQFGGLASLAGVQLQAGNSKDEAIAILRSRSFTEELIVDLNLLPIWCSESWDSEASAWLVDDPQDIPTMWDAYQKSDKTMRRITENPETGLITLAIEWSDRDELLVPTKSQVITVLGETRQNTSHLYRAAITRDEYIDLSGGLTRRADKKLIDVVRANGAVIAGKLLRWLSRGSNVDTGPGDDTIVVPLDTDRMRPLTFWGNVTQIVYHTAIAVPTVQSFDN